MEVADLPFMAKQRDIRTRQGITIGNTHGQHGTCAQISKRAEGQNMAYNVLWSLLKNKVVK